jgi:tRNA-2-methylthio-N6-dimethylallyladenosine synthase
MPDQVPDDVRGERIERLVERIQHHAAARNAALVGTVQEVLVEGPSRTDPSVLRGRTRGGKALNFTGAAPAGSLVEVTVTGSTSQTLSGRQAAPVAAA